MEGKVLKWGNSYGIRINKKDLQNNNIKENEEVEVIIKKKVNPFEQLYLADKPSKISRDTIKQMRKEDPRF